MVFKKTFCSLHKSFFHSLTEPDLSSHASVFYHDSPRLLGYSSSPFKHALCLLPFAPSPLINIHRFVSMPLSIFVSSAAPGLSDIVTVRTRSAHSTAAAAHRGGHCLDSYMKCSVQMGFSCSCNRGSSLRHSTHHDYCFLGARLDVRFYSFTARNLRDCSVMCTTQENREVDVLEGFLEI